MRFAARCLIEAAAAAGSVKRTNLNYTHLHISRALVQSVVAHEMLLFCVWLFFFLSVHRHSLVSNQLCAAAPSLSALRWRLSAVVIYAFKRCCCAHARFYGACVRSRCQASPSLVRSAHEMRRDSVRFVFMRRCACAWCLVLCGG